MKINMAIIRLLINEDLYQLSEMDKNTVSMCIEHLMSDVEISESWIEKLKEKDISLEKYVFDGVVRFMKYKEYSASDLWNHEDDCEIFDCIHMC